MKGEVIKRGKMIFDNNKILISAYKRWITEFQSSRSIKFIKIQSEKIDLITDTDYNVIIFSFFL